MKVYPEVPVSAAMTKNSKWYRLLCVDDIISLSSWLVQQVLQQ